MTTSRHTWKAALWMGGALVSFMAMAISGRELSQELGTFQILFFRSIVSLAVISALLTRSGWGQIKTRRPTQHLLRNLTHFGGQFGWFYAIALIPLADVFAIEFTMPVWTAMFAALFLNERLTPHRIFAVVMGIIGMALILRPGAGLISPGAIAMVLGAICFALANTATKSLTGTETPLSILFYMVVIQFPMALVPSLIHWQTPSPATWPWLLLVGSTALSAHYCVARAFQHADATVVVPMDFLRLPLIAVVGALFYNEPLDGFILAGAVVMCIGNGVSIRAEKSRPPAARG
ncbi:membrane protein [Desulfoluna limicola]|uniref:Membrane protein n=1 Tax=Desulfoluna limicola TaxID=2810562 RepID=A0ABN6FA57_9BACT|nr:DMT family transporter [Desulfoluna limicola]BCS97723.1 membrane protein [Desulfoluna limicola]